MNFNKNSYDKYAYLDTGLFNNTPNNWKINKEELLKEVRTTKVIGLLGKRYSGITTVARISEKFQSYNFNIKNEILKLIRKKHDVFKNNKALAETINTFCNNYKYELYLSFNNTSSTFIKVESKKYKISNGNGFYPNTSPYTNSNSSYSSAYGLQTIDSIYNYEIDEEKLFAFLRDSKNKDKFDMITYPKIKYIMEKYKDEFERGENINTILVDGNNLLKNKSLSELCDEFWYVDVSKNIRNKIIKKVNKNINTYNLDDEYEESLKKEKSKYVILNDSDIKNLVKQVRILL